MGSELLDKQVLYDGEKVRLEVHHLRDEETDRRFKREVVVHPGAVLILPMLDAETVLLIRNYRYAVGRTLLELPAGTLEKGELPLDCAGRELQEETGYLAGKLAPLCTFYTSPGVMSEQMFAFVATDLEPTEQALEEGEDIEVLPTKFADAVRMIREGRIVDGKTVAALLWQDKWAVGSGRSAVED